jgi:hypothetical protein
MAETTGPFVLVTTQHRGVFAGTLIGEASKEKVTLASCRNVLYWDAATRGFLGLASTGPTKGCRVGPAANGSSTLFDVTGVFTCTPEAIKAFEASQWTP